MLPNVSGTNFLNHYITVFAVRNSNEIERADLCVNKVSDSQ